MPTSWQDIKRTLDERGFTDPMTLRFPEAADAVFEETAKLALYTRNPHIRFETVRQLVSDPAITEAVAQLCGTGLVLWRSAFFNKEPGAREIGWHHDKHFSDGDDLVKLEMDLPHYSVFISVTQTGSDNGMLEFVAGSHVDDLDMHRDPRPYHQRPQNEHNLPGLSPAAEARVIAAPLPQYTFMVFHSAILHRSLQNTSGDRRLGLALRLSPGDLTFPEAQATAKDILPYPCASVPA